ncbi:MAG: Ni/Fe-hydrogenase, b-type cytochrome subunit [Bryobacteraceae bacterium]|jgi:Ni/Fe-hydrogenase 1 B-type cytochrome subunit
MVVKSRPAIDYHPRVRVGQAIAVYVWQYPLRLVHWGLVLSIAALSFTGYYIHNPFIVGQTKTPFLMGWFRFAHESFGMAFIALFLLRLSLFFSGDRWVRWQAMVPLHKEQWKEMLQVMKFYAFIRPKPVSKVGHNAMAAFSYIGIYSLMFVEIVTGLVMYNWLAHSPVLTPLVGWVPRLVSFPNIRLIHFCLMFVFIAFGILHVHLCLIVSSAEKRGLLDSIFTGYKIIPVDELEEDDHEAIVAAQGKRVHR